MRYLLSVCFILFAFGISAQTNILTESFQVLGNCGMCKTTIEKSLKKRDGILDKNWDNDTHILTVSYDKDKTNLSEIAQKVAAAGYDNEFFKADDEIYKNLHFCCQYERVEIIKKEKSN